VSARLDRLGTNYGGWYCCPDLLQPGQTALCIGAGDDVSFDIALNGQLGLKVICADPTPRAVEHVKGILNGHASRKPVRIGSGPMTYELSDFDPARFTFVPVAVWSADGQLRLFAPRDPTHVSHSVLNLQRTAGWIDVKAQRISSIVEDFRVGNIQLLKLDIEGAEYEVLDDLLAGAIRPKQILVEFDEILNPLSLFFFLRIRRRICDLLAAGYQLASVERANFLFLYDESSFGS